MFLRQCPGKAQLQRLPLLDPLVAVAPASAALVAKSLGAATTSQTGLQQPGGGMLQMAASPTAIDAPETSGASKPAKKANKVKCYRCNQSGHLSADCTALVCDICESAAHIEDGCPLLSAPKQCMVLVRRL